MWRAAKQRQSWKIICSFAPRLQLDASSSGSRENHSTWADDNDDDDDDDVDVDDDDHEEDLGVSG